MSLSQSGRALQTSETALPTRQDENCSRNSFHAHEDEAYSYTAPKPSNTDILLGRGRKIQQHPGNMSFLRKIDEFLQLYHTSERGKKHETVSMVLDWLARRGGHFVKLDIGGQWVEVSNLVAKEKVALAFRHRKFALKNDCHAVPGFSASLRGLLVPSTACQAQSCDSMGVTTIDHAKFSTVCKEKVQESVILMHSAPELSQQQSGWKTNPGDMLFRLTQYPCARLGTIGGTSLLGRRSDFLSNGSIKSPELVSDEDILRAVREWENARSSNRNSIEDDVTTDDDDDYDLQLFDEIL